MIMKFKLGDLVGYDTGSDYIGFLICRITKVFPNYKGKGLKGYAITVVKRAKNPDDDDYWVGKRWASVKEESLWPLDENFNYPKQGNFYMIKLQKFIPPDTVYSIGEKQVILIIDGVETPLANYTKRGENLCYWYAIRDDKGVWFTFDVRTLPDFDLKKYEKLLVEEYQGEDALLEFVKNHLGGKISNWTDCGLFCQFEFEHILDARVEKIYNSELSIRSI